MPDHTDTVCPTTPPPPIDLQTAAVAFVALRAAACYGDAHLDQLSQLAFDLSHPS